MASKLITASLVEGKTRLLTRSLDKAERAIITQNAQTWSAKATLEGGVSGSSVGTCARLLLELAEVVRCPTSVSLRNHGTAFVQLRLATPDQLDAFKQLDTSGAITDADAEDVFGSWGVLVPWTQLCSREQRSERVPNKWNKVRMFNAKHFNRFLDAGYKGVLVECAPFLDRKKPDDDMIGLQWCCLYGAPYRPGASPPLSQPSSSQAAITVSSDDSSNSFSALLGDTKQPHSSQSQHSQSQSQSQGLLPLASSSSTAAAPALPALSLARPFSSLPSASSPSGSATGSGGGGGSPAPLCSGHSVAAVRRVVRKPDSKDLGRSYFVCAQATPCDYKSWADGTQRSLESPVKDTAAAAVGSDVHSGAKRPRDPVAAAASGDVTAVKPSPSKKPRT